MGIIGSKENLGQLVTIIGYNANDFRWVSRPEKVVYQTGGLLFEHQSKKFVITSYSRINSCDHIMAYHSPFDEKKTIMKNDLYILFQSIEHGLIILGTKGKLEFDPEKSDIVYGGKIPQEICKYHQISFQNLVPTKRTQYYTIKIDLDLDSHSVKYNAQVYRAKYLESFLNDETFVPTQYLYRFRLDNSEKHDLCGIIGSIIFQKKKDGFKLIGMINKDHKNIVTVIPSKIINKTIYDCIYYLDNMNIYSGIVDLPITYKISKSSEIKICKKITFGTKSLLENDKIISIQGQSVIIENDEPKILDIDYKALLPIDLYCRSNFDQNTKIDLLVHRKNKKINLTIQGIPIKESIFPITSQPFYLPSDPIPFIDINGIIIVEFTHTLLDLTALHKIDIKNCIIKKFFTDDNFKERFLFIIDCKNKLLSRKYNYLPELHFNSKQKIIVPILRSIGKIPVRTLDEIKNISYDPEKIKLEKEKDFVDFVFSE